MQLTLADRAVVGRPCRFNIDATKAGTGARDEQASYRIVCAQKQKIAAHIETFVHIKYAFFNHKDRIAGNMEIVISVGDKNCPNFVETKGQAKFEVSFTPQEVQEHVISVKFNGEPVPGMHEQTIVVRKHTFDALLFQAAQ